MHNIASIVDDKGTNGKNQEALSLLEKPRFFLEAGKTKCISGRIHLSKELARILEEKNTNIKCLDNDVIRNIRHPLAFQRMICVYRSGVVVEVTRKTPIYLCTRASQSVF